MGALGIPADPDTERSLLGCIMVNPAVLDDVTRELGDGEALTVAAHKRVYAVMLDLQRRGQALDPMTIHAYLVTTGQADVGECLPGLMDTAGVSVNAAHYARVLKRLWIRREIMGLAEQLREEASKQWDVGELLAHAGGVSDLIAQSDGKVTVGRVGVGAQLRAGMLDGAVTDRFFPTTYGDLDALIWGLRPGNLFIIAARPGVGKTTLALNFARRMGVNDISTLFFSMEMDQQQLSDNLLCAFTPVDGHRLRGGSLVPMEKDEVRDAAESLKHMEVTFHCAGRLSDVNVRTGIQRAKGRGNVHVVVVDYLQEMAMTGGRNQRRYEVIGETVRTLKGIAIDEGVAMVVLSQLSRAVDQGDKDRKPRLSDLRESGDIEQAADQVLLLHREMLAGKELNPGGESVLLLLAKNRNGRTGKLEMRFFPAQFRFEGAARGGDDGRL